MAQLPGSVIPQQQDKMWEMPPVLPGAVLQPQQGLCVPLGQDRERAVFH